MQPYWEPASCRSPVKTPAASCFPTISLSPSAARPPAPRPRRCCWKHCGSRKWSAAGAPCAPGRLCCPTGTPKRGRTLPQRRRRKCRTHFRGWHRPPRALPRPPFPLSPPKTPLRRPETFSNCSPNSTIGNGPLPGSPRWRRAARPLPVWPLPLPSCSLKPKLPSPGCLPIRPVGTVFMKDRSWRPSLSHSSAATFPVRSSPTYRSLSIPRTVNGS